MAKKEYHRLTRPRIRRTSFFTVTTSRASLWLGKDHLLAIDSTGYVEAYKRFYFRDIQAVILTGSKRRLVWNWLLGIPTVVCLWIWAADIISNQSSIGGTITGTIITSLFAIPLLVNNLLGPTCNCHLRTAVQIEDVPSLGRLRRARRVLTRIRPLIIAAQGQLTPDEIATRLRELARTAAVAPGPASPSVVADDPNAPPRMAS